jgi:ABC-type branched-subunit amino acid transport system substrate-binding protein
MSYKEGVLQLKAIFSDFDEEVLAAILSDCNGNLEQATDVILSMASGESIQLPTGHNLNLIEEDERLARQLQNELNMQGGFGIPGRFPMNEEEEPYDNDLAIAELLQAQEQRLMYHDSSDGEI